MMTKKPLNLAIPSLVPFKRATSEEQKREKADYNGLMSKWEVQGERAKGRKKMEYYFEGEKRQKKGE